MNAFFCIYREKVGVVQFYKAYKKLLHLSENNYKIQIFII